MPRKIAFARIIDRKNTKQLTRDPAQMGGFRVAIADDGMLTITGIRNVVVFRAERSVAARWENEETVLLVQRKVGSQEMVVRRAFRSRLHRDWDGEDVAGATASVAPENSNLAIVFTLPNASVGVLPFRSPLQEWTARVNLGAAPESTEWIPGKKAQLIVKVSNSSYKWIAGQTRFTRTAIATASASPEEAETSTTDRT